MSKFQKKVNNKNLRKQLTANYKIKMKKMKKNKKNQKMKQKSLMIFYNGTLNKQIIQNQASDQKLHKF